jgi:hypothetical protein
MVEVREDLYTQLEYSKLIGKTPARVNQLVKSGLLNIMKVKGTVLIKVS